jgi:hypothetical protein
MSNPEGIARRCELPNEEFAAAWTAIKLVDGVRELAGTGALVLYRAAEALL